VKPPDAQSIHTGYGLPNWPRLKRIQEWLKANGIDPRLVAVNRPVYVLPVPNGTIQGGVPWLIDVIVFHEYYENPDGHRERNFITNEAVMFQRTVPLQVPFPADPTTDGGDRGQADLEEAQQAAEEVVRPSGQEGLSDPRQGPRQGGPVAGGAAWDEGSAEEGTGRGDQEVPEPEEDRREEVRQEEVGGER
jgi:hypothetical protein